jgi:hypothetical protein
LGPTKEGGKEEGKRQKKRRSLRDDQKDLGKEGQERAVEAFRKPTGWERGRKLGSPSGPGGNQERRKEELFDDDY